MPTRKKSTKVKSFPRWTNKPKVQDKPKKFQTPSPLPGHTPSPKPGSNSELKTFLKHKEWVTGDPLSTRLQRVRQQIDQGTYQRPKQYGELRDRKSGFGTRIGSVPGTRIEEANLVGRKITGPDARAKKKALEEHKKKRQAAEPRMRMEIDPNFSKTKKDFRRIRDGERRIAGMQARNAAQSQRDADVQDKAVQRALESHARRVRESEDREAWER